GGWLFRSVAVFGRGRGCPPRWWGGGGGAGRPAGRSAPARRDAGPTRQINCGRPLGFLGGRFIAAKESHDPLPEVLPIALDRLDPLAQPCVQILGGRRF